VAKGPRDGAAQQQRGAVEWIKEEREKKRKGKRKRKKRKKKINLDKWAPQWIDDDIEDGWVREKMV
jgi:hypothetical protein